LQVSIVLINGKIGRIEIGFTPLEMVLQMAIKKLKIFSGCSKLFINRLCICVKIFGKIFLTGTCMLKIKPALLHSQSGTTVAKTIETTSLAEAEQRSLT
jgi:hypothetical protein